MNPGGWDRRAEDGIGRPRVMAAGLAADRTDLRPEDTAFLAEVVGALARDPFAPAARLARGLYVSPSHLAHRFRAVAGISPGAFALALRMQEAKRLLIETRLPVVEVALEVGYDSLGTFTTRFASLVGASPGRFRARLDALEESPSPPMPGPAPGEAAVVGRLEAPAGFQGVAFVGLFPSNLPAGRPSAGVIAPVPGHYRIRRCAPGWYRVLVACFDSAPGPRELLLSRAALVGAGTHAVAVGHHGTALCDVSLRPPTAGDPPVVVSLAHLRAPGPAGA